MWISEVDPLRLRAGEAEPSQARNEIRWRFVGERFAERESEGRCAAFLDRVPRVLESRGWVLFFDDQEAAVCETRMAAGQQRVPFVERDFVEDVGDGDHVEGAGDDGVEADHELDTGDAPHLA